MRGRSLGLISSQTGQSFVGSPLTEASSLVRWCAFWRNFMTVELIGPI